MSMNRVKSKGLKKIETCSDGENNGKQAVSHVTGGNVFSSL